MLYHMPFPMIIRLIQWTWMLQGTYSIKVEENIQPVQDSNSLEGQGQGLAGQNGA